MKNISFRFPTSIRDIKVLWKEYTSKRYRHNVEVVRANVKMAMRRDKLKFYQEEIQGMLMQLPRKFRETDGSGWSFLNLCTREDGTQWTGIHAMMEQLVILGIGSGKMKYLLPKPMWNILPGGMPYLAVLDKNL